MIKQSETQHLWLTQGDEKNRITRLLPSFAPPGNDLTHMAQMMGVKKGKTKKGANLEEGRNVLGGRKEDKKRRKVKEPRKPSEEGQKGES